MIHSLVDNTAYEPRYVSHRFNYHHDVFRVLNTRFSLQRCVVCHACGKIKANRDVAIHIHVDISNRISKEKTHAEHHTCVLFCQLFTPLKIISNDFTDVIILIKDFIFDIE